MIRFAMTENFILCIFEKLFSAFFVFTRNTHLFYVRKAERNLREQKIYLQYISGANVAVVECWAPRIEVSRKLV